MKVEGWWRHVIHMHKPGKGDLLIDFLLVLSFHHPLLQPLRLPVASFRRQSMGKAEQENALQNEQPRSLRQVPLQFDQRTIHGRLYDSAILQN
jgi:hypothetical protein